MDKNFQQQRIEANDSSLLTVVLDVDNEHSKQIVTLASSLCSNSVVTTLELHGGNHPLKIKIWKMLFRMLLINKTIHTLDFSWCNINLKCAQLFASTVLVKSTILANVIFESNNEMGLEGISIVVDALCANPNGCTLTLLAFCNVTKANSCNKINKSSLAKKFITLLQKNTTQLEDLNLERNCLGDDFVSIFASVLRYENKLQILDLSSNEVTNTGADALATALRYNSTLVEMNISSNKINHEGAKASANALYYNSTLVKLYLSGNDFGDDGVIAITTALRYHASIETLHLEDIDISEGSFTKAISFLKYNESLRSLYCTIHAVLMQPVFNYNDTIHYCCVGYSSVNRRMCQMLEENSRGVRTALKKGLLRRQEMFMWLGIDWISFNYKHGNLIK